MGDIIKGYEERLRIAMINCDIEESDKLFSDELLFINHKGMFISKSDDIAFAKSGMVKISDIRIKSQHVRIAGDVAIVVSDSELDVIISNEQLTDHIIYTRIWQRFGDEWKLVGGQATPVA